MIIKDNVLLPSEGMVLTDGNVYLKKVYLCNNNNAENYHEITKEEYAKILEEKEKEELEII